MTIIKLLFSKNMLSILYWYESTSKV